MLATAVNAEAFSKHPLAAALLNPADEQDIDYADYQKFDSVTGKGVREMVDGSAVLVDKPDCFDDEGIDLAASDEIEQFQHWGLRFSGVVCDTELVGLIGVGNKIKDDAAEPVQRMKNASIPPVLITGDKERTAEAVGTDRVIAIVLPAETH